MKRVLVVEDDRALGEGVCLALRGADMETARAGDISSARREMEERGADIVLLDINLPDGNGLKLLKEIKKASRVPVILLTANDMETDIVTGLELGADDYITKPFSLAVLRARVNARLRGSADGGERFELDGFVFDFARMEFSRGGRSVELSRTEQKLLRCLVENRGATLPRQTLVDRIWTDGAEYVDENALSVTVKRLRDKLEETPAKPEHIKTAYGLGYTWAVKKNGHA